MEKSTQLLEKVVNEMLSVKKRVIGELNKCYSLTKLRFDGKSYLACASEKKDACYMFDVDGNYIETLWDGPGGVMTMEQYGDSILSTWKFYSPNDSANAKIVYYQKVNNKWICKTLCDLPFVHRFGVLKSNGFNYLIACTLKSAHAYKNDWTCPGRVWGALLPDDISIFDDNNQLKIEAILSGLSHNHGFYRVCNSEDSYSLIGTDNGIYKVAPPKSIDAEWLYEKVYDQPVSDMVYDDFDNDGKNEMIIISPFHGDVLKILKWDKDQYKTVYQYPEQLPFLHALCTGRINGKTYAFVGYREGKSELMAINYNPDLMTYESQVIDEGTGTANCMFYYNNNKCQLAAANRGKNEIALYTLEQE